MDSPAGGNQFKEHVVDLRGTVRVYIPEDVHKKVNTRNTGFFSGSTAKGLTLKAEINIMN